MTPQTKKIRLFSAEKFKKCSNEINLLNTIQILSKDFSLKLSLKVATSKQLCCSFDRGELVKNACLSNDQELFFEGNSHFSEVYFNNNQDVNAVIPLITHDNEMVGVLCLELPASDRVKDFPLHDLLFESTNGLPFCEFIQKSFGFILSLCVHKQQMGHFLPGLTEFYDCKQLEVQFRLKDKLFNAMMELAFKISEADTGSVLLYSSIDNCWKMELAYGLRDNISNKYSSVIDSDLADHIRNVKKGILLNRQSKSGQEVGKFLHRQEVSASMIVPIQNLNLDYFEGVFCMTSYDHQVKFSYSDLWFLEFIAKLSCTFLMSGREVGENVKS